MGYHGNWTARASSGGYTLRMSRTDQYLLAIYIAGHRAEPPVPPGDIAAMLDRSPSAVTEMCQRLDADGLVEYEAYEGATLTDVGRSRATACHQSYVTLSWFFRSVLELDDYEMEAMRLAGLVSPDVAHRLAATLPCDTDDMEGTDEYADNSPPF
jgi:DtxR family Mn-dependent transcriptional regulator